MKRFGSPLPGFQGHTSRSATLIMLGLGALLAAPRAARAQRSHRDGTERRNTEAAPDRYRLLGVYDETSGAPLDSVRVTDVLTGTSMLTSATGTATLVFLPDGGSLVRLQKIGYEVKTMVVPIGPADTAPVTVMLARITRLPSVVVTDSAEPYLSSMLRDFERRKRAGIGTFIDEAEIRKHDNTTMTNLLTSHLPGLMPVVAPGAAVYVVATRTMCEGLAFSMCRSPNCYPTVYVDGVQYSDNMGSRPNAVDFSKWSPMEFAAVEYYSSAELPSELGGPGTNCGVLMLWTRER